MTHTTDCTVEDDDRERMTEIAKELVGGLRPGEDAREMIEQEGLEEIGAGAGRRTFRIPQSMQEGPRDTPFRESPCVIKFARSKGAGGARGTTQIQEEVSQYLSLSPQLTQELDGELPPFLPVGDWNDGCMQSNPGSDPCLWETMPEAKQPEDVNMREKAKEVKKKIKDRGYKCIDMKAANTGVIHNEEPVVIDYGLNCEPLKGHNDMMNAVKFRLEEIGARNVTEEDAQAVEFIPPAGVGTEPIEINSQFLFDDENGVASFNFFFGPWPLSTDQDELEMASESAVDAINSEYGAQLNNPFGFSRVIDDEYVIEVASNFLDPVTPDTAVGVFETVLATMLSELPGPGSESDDVSDTVRGTITRAVIRRARNN